jgi:hypothetical protein
MSESAKAAADETQGETAFDYAKQYPAVFRLPLDAVPDGWAKVGGKWVQLEPRKVTHWRVVSDANAGIVYSADSRREGRWGITDAQHWLEHWRDLGNTCHLETWEETWWDTPTRWRRIDAEHTEEGS